MFNQKLNSYKGNDLDYISESYNGNFKITPHKQIPFNLTKKCSTDSLQIWCSKNFATLAQGTRPLVSSTEYFNNISEYLKSLVQEYSAENNEISKNDYLIVTGSGNNPNEEMYIQKLQEDLTHFINVIIANSADQMPMFKEYNPFVSEGFVLTDIDIQTFQSKENPNYFYHKVVFSAVNTTRYNTVSFKMGVYQDATALAEEYLKNPKNYNGTTVIYIDHLQLLNDNLNGNQFDAYDVNAHNIITSFLPSEKDLQQRNNVWSKLDTVTDNKYDLYGNYNQDGTLDIQDNGPSNLDKLIKDMGEYILK